MSKIGILKNYGGAESRHGGAARITQVNGLYRPINGFNLLPCVIMIKRLNTYIFHFIHTK